MDYDNSSITIYTREGREKKKNMSKQLQKVNEKLDKMLEEKDNLKRKRDENREKAKQFFHKSRLARERRDEINDTIKSRKKERNKHFKARDAKANEKKEVVAKLNASNDSKEKKQLYEQLQIVKKELTACYEKADEAHKEVQELAKKSQENHIEMKTYIEMGKQAHGIADNRHAEVVSISKKIKKLFKERNKLRRS